MADLFDNDPAFVTGRVTTKQTLVRNRRGQFCTQEQKQVEDTMRENRILKRKAETYYHNWMAVADRAVRLDRENNKLKTELETCRKEIKQLKRGERRKPKK